MNTLIAIVATAGVCVFILPRLLFVLVRRRPNRFLRLLVRFIWPRVPGAEPGADRASTAALVDPNNSPAATAVLDDVHEPESASLTAFTQISDAQHQELLAWANTEPSRTLGPAPLSSPTDHAMALAAASGRSDPSVAGQDEELMPADRDSDSLSAAVPSAQIVHLPVPYDQGQTDEGAAIPEKSGPGWAIDTLPPRGDGHPRARLQGVDDRSIDVLITDDDVVIGRDWDADVVVRGDLVSRRHCRLSFRSGEWYVSDLDSANGTFVGDVRVRRRPMPLRDQLLRVADITLRLRTPTVQQRRLVFDAAGAGDQGTRRNNQDAWHAARDLIAVADGVAGRPAGEIASNLALEQVAHQLGQGSLREIAQGVNRLLWERSETDPAVRGMATTLDAARLVSESGGWRVAGAHVGDGLAIVRNNAQLRVLTSAHTVGQELVAAGQRATGHPARTRLERALGLESEVEVDEWSEVARDGQRFVLSTDGLLDALGLDNLLHLVDRTGHWSPAAAADELIRQALTTTGNIDNISVVVADVVPAAG